MKATDFVNFFDFCIVTAKDYGKIIDEDIEPEEANDINYVAIDRQGVFQNRYIVNIHDIVDCFDSMLTDYIDTNIEEDGFNYNPEMGTTYYEQALKWVKENPDEECYKDVIEALVYPETIIDDVIQEANNESN